MVKRLKNVYSDRYEHQFGYYHSITEKVFFRYLDCGILRHGFARIRCDQCHNEYLLAFSCKTRFFCPSCHAKRFVVFAEWVCDEVLEPVTHRHYVFSIPKILRTYFRYNRNQTSTYDPLDFLAYVSLHIPDKGEQLLRYYGWYSNKSRGLRKKDRRQPSPIPPVEEDLTHYQKQYRSAWARLIRKIYEVEPLLCPKCKHPMRVIAFIENDPAIRKILKHLGLWETHSHSPPPSPDISFCLRENRIGLSTKGLKSLPGA